MIKTKQLMNEKKMFYFKCATFFYHCSCYWEIDRSFCDPRGTE